MRNLKRLTSLAMSATLALSISVPTFAAVGDTGCSDVDADSWYAEAAVYCRDNGLMSGTSATTFSPNAAVTRGQAVPFLYRAAGAPTVERDHLFEDVAPEAYYADAVQWAVAEKITNGTGNTTFSPAADCTRGHIVTFLYRNDAK